MKGWVETFRGRGIDPWRFCLRSVNGQIIAQSEGYSSLSNVRRIARKLAAQLRWRVVHVGSAGR